MKSITDLAEQRAFEEKYFAFTDVVVEALTNIVYPTPEERKRNLNMETHWHAMKLNAKLNEMTKEFIKEIK